MSRTFPQVPGQLTLIGHISRFHRHRDPARQRPSFFKSDIPRRLDLAFFLECFTPHQLSGRGRPSLASHPRLSWCVKPGVKLSDQSNPSQLTTDHPQLTMPHPSPSSEATTDAPPKFSNDGARRDWLIEALGEATCRKLGLFPIPQDLTLSVVIPCYDERATIREILRRVRAVPIKKQIIVVDDCSRDGTREILRELDNRGDADLKVVFQDRNQGKGAALRTGFRYATGDIVIVQDADLEYDPEQYPELIQPIVDDQADVVFGSRFIGESHRVLYYWHSLANKGLTLLSNMFTNLNLTDMEVCYKVFRREIIQGIVLKSDRFGFEPEVTAKVARFKIPGENGAAPRPCRIYEVPVAYHGRTYREGKKIGLKDGFQALYCILRYAFAD
jgi:hypothetical protein